MPAWNDITRSEDYQALPPPSKQRIKTLFFQQHIAPEFDAADREWAAQKFMESPDDSGQSYAASLANAAGRGFAAVVPGTIGGIGAVTGIDALREAGDSIEQSINATLPVNPTNEGWGTIIAGGVGQGVSIIATAGVGGAVGKGLSAARTAAEASKAIQFGSQVASMGTGVLSGASEGADIADQRGLEGGDRFAMTFGKGAFEALSEKLPFGQLAETAAARRLMGGAVSEKVPGFIGSALSEGAEEVSSQIASNALETSVAKPGQTTPDLLDGTLESAVGGMAGGAVFGAVNAAITKPEATTTPGAPQPQAATLSATPTTPIEAASVELGGISFERDESGTWRKPVTDFESERSMMDDQGRVALSPDDPIAGQIIPILEAEVNKSKPTEEAPLTLESIPTNEPIVDERLTLDAIPAEEPRVRAPSPLTIDSLPAAEGTDDIISIIQGEGMRLGQITDGGEWDWYRELTKTAKSSRLNPLAAQKAARLGQLDDPAALKAWVDANVMSFDPAAGKKIDEAAMELASAPNQSFKVDSSSIGTAILDAIDARLKAQVTGTFDARMSALEAEELAKEATQEAAFIALDVTSAAPEVTAASFAKETAEGGSVTIAGKVFTVEFVNADQGIVSLSNPEIGNVTLRGPDTFRPDSVEAPSEDENPFSPAVAKASQKINDRELTRLGLPTKTKSRVWGKKHIKTALVSAANDERLPANTKAIAEILSGLDLNGLLFSVHADGRLPWAGQYQPYKDGIGELMINTRGRGEGNVNEELNVLETIIHETLHHATYRAIRGPKNATQRAAIKNLEALRIRAKAVLGAQENDSFDYQLSSTDEFISALFTQADFQRMLASIPSELKPKGIIERARTMLDDVFRMLAEIVTGSAVEVGSILDEAFSNSISLIDIGGKSDGEPLRSPSRLGRGLGTLLGDKPKATQGLDRQALDLAIAAAQKADGFKGTLNNLIDRARSLASGEGHIELSGTDSITVPQAIKKIAAGEDANLVAGQWQQHKNDVLQGRTTEGSPWVAGISIQGTPTPRLTPPPQPDTKSTTPQLTREQRLARMAALDAGLSAGEASEAALFDGFAGKLKTITEETERLGQAELATAMMAEGFSEAEAIKATNGTRNFQPLLAERARRLLITPSSDDRFRSTYAKLDVKKQGRIHIPTLARKAGLEPEEIRELLGRLSDEGELYLTPSDDGTASIPEADRPFLVNGPSGKALYVTMFDMPAPLQSPSGHAQPLGEAVMTPHGELAIGRLYAGAQITTNGGYGTTVTGVFPQGEKPVFRVTLSDGRSTRTTANHLWMVENGNILTTADIKGRKVPALLDPRESFLSSAGGRQ